MLSNLFAVQCLDNSGHKMQSRNVNYQCEVLELENMKKTDFRIGPEINIDSVCEVETHSSFICLKCNKKVN